MASVTNTRLWWLRADDDHVTRVSREPWDTPCRCACRKYQQAAPQRGRPLTSTHPFPMSPQAAQAVAQAAVQAAVQAVDQRAWRHLGRRHSQARKWPR